jgi:hypothetical protein
MTNKILQNLDRILEALSEALENMEEKDGKDYWHFCGQIYALRTFRSTIERYFYHPPSLQRYKNSMEVFEKYLSTYYNLMRQKVLNYETLESLKVINTVKEAFNDIFKGEQRRKMKDHCDHIENIREFKQYLGDLTYRLNCMIQNHKNNLHDMELLKEKTHKVLEKFNQLFGEQ